MSETAIDSPAAVGEAPRWSRWSDRLNPILVREIQQALKGRALTLSLLLALLVVLLVAVIAVGRADARRAIGGDVFSWGLAILCPLLLFVVPLQAYHAMRLEMRSGILEQLLLSDLRPWRIVFGKLQAALVQFGLFVAALSPLLATSYLLRGVDLPSIAFSLGAALLVCVAATAFAVSAAAQGALPGMQGFANIGVAMGLGSASFGMIGYLLSGTYQQDLAWLLSSSDGVTVIASFVLFVLGGVVLSMLVAQSFLAHVYENKSTGFRIYLFVVAGIALFWMAWNAPGAVREWLPFAVIMLVLLGTGFGLFMVTEQAPLSIHMRAHVPRQPLFAFLVAPWLPGRDRGVCTMLIYFALLTAVLAAAWPDWGVDWRTRFWRSAAMAIAYAVVYLGIARWLRRLMPASLLGNHLARFATPMVLLFGCVIPVLLDLFVRGEVGHWHPGHLLNPFFTIAILSGNEAAESMGIVLTLAAVVAAALVVPALRGLREVMTASYLRRQHG